jgi:hypothetical protein
LSREEPSFLFRQNAVDSANVARYDFGGGESMEPEFDTDFDALESVLPLASGEAFAAARLRALGCGQSVLQSEGGFIYEVYPDGRGKLVEITDPPISIEPGQEIRLR